MTMLMSIACSRANRAVSPADSLGSASAFTGKPVEPRTARQLAAAANKARKAERDDDGSDDSRDEPRKGGLPMQVTASQDSMLDRGAGGGGAGGVGLGLDVGSREGSHVGGRSANATPTLASATVLNDKGAGAGARGGRMRAGMKRPRADDEDEDESEPEDEDVKPPTKRNGGGKKTTANAANSNAQAQDLDVIDTDPMDGEVDSKVYCTCRQVSYGEMIGCDDDECEIEWVSGCFLLCVTLSCSKLRTSEGEIPTLTLSTTTLRLVALRPGPSVSVGPGCS